MGVGWEIIRLVVLLEEMKKKGKKDSKVDIIIWTKPMLDEDAQNR